MGRPEVDQVSRMGVSTLWVGAHNLYLRTKKLVLRAGGAIRASLGRACGPRGGLSAEEREALERLLRAQRERSEAEELLRRVHEVSAAVRGEGPVPEGVVLDLDGRIYPPGSHVRRTLRLIQGGRA